MLSCKEGYVIQSGSIFETSSDLVVLIHHVHREIANSLGNDIADAMINKTVELAFKLEGHDPENVEEEEHD